MFFILAGNCDNVIMKGEREAFSESSATPPGFYRYDFVRFISVTKSGLSFFIKS